MCPGYSFYQQQIVTKRLWLVVSPPLPRFSPLGEPTMRSRTIAALVMILLAELSAGRRRNMASLPSKFEMNGSHKMNGSHTLVVQLQSTVDLRAPPRVPQFTRPPPPRRLNRPARQPRDQQDTSRRYGSACRVYGNAPSQAPPNDVMAREATFRVARTSSDVCCCMLSCRCMRDAGQPTVEVRPPAMFCRLFDLAASCNLHFN